MLEELQKNILFLLQFVIVMEEVINEIRNLKGYQKGNKEIKMIYNGDVLIWRTRGQNNTNTENINGEK